MTSELEIDETLLSKAKTLSGISDVTELLNEGLRVLIQREAANRLALLGGSDPDIKDVPRRRFGHQ